MSDVNVDEVEEKLQRALENSSTPETELETPTIEAEEIEEEDGENRIPQSRFNEINEALKETRLESLETRDQLAETQDKLLRMAELLEAKEADVQTLNEIKGYVNDPEMKDHVIAIDQKLKGIEVVQEMEDAGELTPEDAVELTAELLEEAQEELRDTQADVQADQLIARADVISEGLLQALPEEYNEEDIDVINDLFHEKVDWDSAVEFPDELSDILTQGFQETIDRYGMPRGALFDAEEVDVLAPEVPEEDLMTPEEELRDLMDLPWGDIVEVEDEAGNVSIEPEMSTDDFNTVLAQAIRLAHEGEE